jgi:hypothetical protein
MKTMKPILGKKQVVILDTTKKGTEDRFTITLEMKVANSERTFKDVIFYDAANTTRVSVVPAILCALAEQTGLEIDKFRTEDEDGYEWNVEKVLKHIKGKEITVERTAVVSERNGQTYYNVNYRPDAVVEQEVEL